MSAWSTTAAGTAILAGMVLTGLTLWQGATRKQVSVLDWADLVEGYQERAAAVYAAPHVRTNSYPCYTADSRQYVHHYAGTNAVWTNYLAWVSNAVAVTTNWWVDRTGGPLEDFSSVIIGRMVGAVGSQQVITGYGDSYTLNAVSNPYAGFLNMAPSGYPQLSKFVTIYYSGSYYGYEMGLASDGDRWFWVDAAYLAGGAFAFTEVGRPLTNATWYVSSGTTIDVSVASSGSMASNLVECNAREWAVANFAIDRNLSRAAVAAVASGTLGLIPNYLDQTYSTNGSYEAYFATPYYTTNMGFIHTNYPSGAPVLTVSNVFSRLQIGNKTNLFTITPAFTLPAHTNWVYAFTNWWPSNGAPHAVCYTGSEYQAASCYATNWSTNGYGWSWYSNAIALPVAASNIPATFGTVPAMMIYTNTLVEVAKVLAYLKDVGLTTDQWLWTNCIKSVATVDQGIAPDQMSGGTNPTPPPIWLGTYYALTSSPVFVDDWFPPSTVGPYSSQLNGGSQYAQAPYSGENPDQLTPSLNEYTASVSTGAFWSPVRSYSYSWSYPDWPYVPRMQENAQDFTHVSGDLNLRNYADALKGLTGTVIMALGVSVIADGGSDEANLPTNNYIPANLIYVTVDSQTVQSVPFSTNFEGNLADSMRFGFTNQYHEDFSWGYYSVGLGVKQVITRWHFNHCTN